MLHAAKREKVMGGFTERGQEQTMKVKRRVTSLPRGLFQDDRSPVVRSQQVAGAAETAEGIVVQQMELGLARKHAAMLAQNRVKGNMAPRISILPNDQAGVDLPTQLGPGTSLFTETFCVPGTWGSR